MITESILSFPSALQTHKPKPPANEDYYTLGSMTALSLHNRPTTRLPLALADKTRQCE